MAEDTEGLIDEVVASSPNCGARRTGSTRRWRRSSDSTAPTCAASASCTGGGRVTAGELAGESGLTPGAITAVLDRIERNGYATAWPTPATAVACWSLRTVATRELGARVYGEVELAGRAHSRSSTPNR